MLIAVKLNGVWRRCEISRTFLRNDVQRGRGSGRGGGEGIRRDRDRDAMTSNDGRKNLDMSSFIVEILMEDEMIV